MASLTSLSIKNCLAYTAVSFARLQDLAKVDFTLVGQIFSGPIRSTSPHLRWSSIGSSVNNLVRLTSRILANVFWPPPLDATMHNSFDDMHLPVLLL